jgi:hypothetical protein
MKTAVEWLFSQLSINNIALDKGTRAHQEMEQKLLDKAKAMEEESKKDYHFYKTYWEVRNVKKCKQQEQ